MLYMLLTIYGTWMTQVYELSMRDMIQVLDLINLADRYSKFITITTKKEN